MTLITTIGGTDSDSYATLAEADAYAVSFGNGTWAGYSDTQKEVALRKAARWVDGHNFTGYKAASTQALQWPRIGATNDCYAISSIEIPKEIKDAQCEAAFREAVASMQADTKDGFVIEETVGVITKKYSDNSRTGKTKYPIIEAILRPLKAAGGSYHRVSV